MAILKKLKRRLTNSEGVVAIIVAILLVAFVGMTALVVDMGSLYEDRTSLQSVADAAALAGAQELPQSPAKATTAATEYITKNRADIDSINILISSRPGGAPNDTITATVNNPDSPITFGRVFGASSANVGAVAKAIVGRPKTFINDVVPWAVIQNTWVPGVEYPIWEDKAVAVSFKDQKTGAKVYKENIYPGYGGTLEIDDNVNVLNGFKVGGTKELEDRIGPAGLLDDFFTVLTEPSVGGYRLLKPEDTQFVVCPIITQATADGKDGPIIGFAAFIITYFDNKEVRGRLINEALVVYTGSILPVDYTGIKVVRLIQ